VAGFRISAWGQYLGGFIDREDPYTGAIVERNINTAESYVVRPAFTVAPFENLQITASLFLQHQFNPNGNSYWVTDLPYFENGSHVLGGTDQPMTDDLRVSSLSIKYNFGNVAFDSDTSYLDRSSDTREDTTHLWETLIGGEPFIPGVPTSFVAYEQNHSSTTAWQQEFRFSSQGDESSRINWVGGLFYRVADQVLKQLQPPDFSPATLAADGQTAAEFFGNPDYVYNGQDISDYGYYRTQDVSEAVFGDVTIGLTTQLKLDAGVRVEHQVVDKQTQYVGGNFGTSYLTPPDAVANPVTPRVSLTYQLTNSDMVYVSASKGDRPGGGNNTAGINGNPECTSSLNALGLKEAPSEFAPDSLWSYEIGTKDMLFDRHLMVDASVYYIKWSNIQTAVGLTNCANGITLNLTSAVSQGFDLQLAAFMTPELTFGGQVGYTDAYYPKATYGGPVSEPDGSLGPPALLNAAGDKLPNVVAWTASANAEYKRSIDELWSGAHSYLRLDYRWTGAANANPSLNPNVANYDPELSPYPNPSYGMLNVRLGLTHGGWDLSFYVQNVTDSDPRLGYWHDVMGESLFTANAIRPRTYGLTSWYRF
jgi:outer membrane receptor protein involved in Fe transport